MKSNIIKHFIVFFVLLVSVPAFAQFDSAPAFPGAEGYGRFVKGARAAANPEIYHVTNLNDSGSGSLRDAVSQSGRFIVFDVCGIIHLESDLILNKGNITIMGHTAPGGGITVTDYSVQLKADNIIIRFMRFRRGNAKDFNDSADAIWGKNISNIILDHCSMSWSIDETASFYDNNNFTMQWCNISESLNNAGHGKTAHGYGGIWGGKGASFHHNLLNNHSNRTPRLNGARYNWQGYDHDKYKNTIEAERVDLRNCVMYNWGQGEGAYGAPGGGYHNIVNNYYKAGAATKNKTTIFTYYGNSNSDSKGAIPDGTYSKYYVKGNYVAAASSPSNYDWTGMKKKSSDGFSLNVDTIKLSAEVDAGYVTTHTAEKAFEKVLDYAGASLVRDNHDIRYKNEALNGTTTYSGSITKQAGIIDTQNEVGGLESIPFQERDEDADNDGIPDWWEDKYGLNAHDAIDALSYSLDSRNFYTNLEVYANSIVEQIMKEENNDAISPVAEYYPELTEIVERIIALNPNEVPLTIDMMKKWDGSGVDANATNEKLYLDDKIGLSDLSDAGSVIYGESNVYYLNFVDLSQYESMTITGTGSLRVMFNRLVNEGDLVEINPQWDANGESTIVFDDNDKLKEFVHLNCIKVGWGSTAKVESITLKLKNSPSYLLSGSGFIASTAKTALQDANATSIDASKVLGSGITLNSVNPNCLFFAESGVLANDKNVCVDGVVENLVISDGNPFKAPMNFTASKVTYDRSANTVLKKNFYATVYVPYKFDPDALGITAYKYAGYDTYTGNLNFVEVAAANIQPNTPYIVRQADSNSAESVSLNLSINNSVDIVRPVDAIPEDNAFIGTTEELTLYAEAGGYAYYGYSAANGDFRRANADGTKCPPLRGYFRLKTSLLPSNSAKDRIAVNWIDLDANGIIAVSGEDREIDTYIYNMQGQKLGTNRSGLAPGIYIQSGRKFVVR